MTHDNKGLSAHDFLESYGAEVESILRTEPTYGYRRLIKDFGVSERVARKALKMLRNSGLPTLELTANGNEATISLTGERMPSAEELVELAGLEPKEWHIEDVTTGAWEVARKNRKADITWNDGVMTGDMKDSGGFSRSILKRIAVKARRKVLINPAFPTIKGVSIPKWDRPRGGAIEREGKLALIIGDTHVGFRRDLQSGQLSPFQDRQVLEVFLQAVERYKPDEIVLGGDMLDLNEWTTKFIQEPEFAATTQPALEELAWWLRQLREVAPADCKITWVEGNHDARLTTAVITNLKSAYGIKQTDSVSNYEALSLPNLLRLDDLDIDFIGSYPESEHWLSPNLRVVHGNISGKHTAATYATEAQVSTIFHHTHRRDYSTQTMQSSRNVVIAVNSGCACRTDGVVPGSTSRVNWQQGFTIARYNDGNRHTVIPVPVQDGIAFLPDGELTGEDYVDALREALPGWRW